MNILGLVGSLFEALQFTQFYSRLQHNLLAWNKQDPSLNWPMRLSSQASKFLALWISRLALTMAKSILPYQWKIIRCQSFRLGCSIQSFTDSMNRVINGSQALIKILELRAIRMVLQHWILWRHPTKVQSDTTAVAYINHQGGPRGHAALKEASQIVSPMEKHCPAISAVHIPAVDN